MKILANGSNEGDSESSDAGESDDDNSGDDDDQPTRFEAGRSRYGRRVTRICAVTSPEKITVCILIFTGCANLIIFPIISENHISKIKT